MTNDGFRHCTGIILGKRFTRTAFGNACAGKFLLFSEHQ